MNKHLNEYEKQTKKYKYYQNKITQHLLQNKDKYDVIDIEGFTTNNSLNNSEDQKQFDILENTFNNVLNMYETYDNELNSTIKKNLNIYNVSNPFLNHNVKFTNGITGYVTNEGILRIYPSNEITINSAPLLNIDFSPSNELLFAGNILETTPPLLVGNSMPSSEKAVGKEGQNVFVSSIDSISNYVGCYKDTDIRAMDMENDSSLGYTYEQCKQKAIEKGVPYFALQNGSQCGTSNDYTKATQYGEGNTYNYKTIWSLSPSSLVANCSCRLQNNADIYFYDSESNIILKMSESDSSTKYVNPDFLVNCLDNPNITNINATYGFKCNTDPSPSTSTYNVPLNNVGPDITKQVGNSSNFLYHVGVNADGTFIDPAYGCTKDFNISYNCGSTIKTAVANPEASNYPITLDCTDVINNCVCFLALQNDGNLCIYSGTGDADASTVVFALETNGIEKIANPNWVSSKGKTGTYFMTSGVSLYPGEWIGSDDGSMHLIMDSSGVLSLIITESLTNQCLKNNDTGTMYGTSWTNAIYELSPIPNPQLFGKMGYVDGNSKLMEYPQSMIGKRNEYITLNNTTINGNDIPNMSVPNTTLENCTNVCNSSLDCDSFVFDPTNNNCFPKSNPNEYPQIKKVYDAQLNTYMKKPVVKNTYTNSYTEYFNSDSPQNDIYEGQIENTTKENCSTYCDNNSDCVGYVFDNNESKCWLKNSINKTNIVPSENHNVYIRNVESKNYDIKTIKDIDASTWNSYENNGELMSPSSSYPSVLLTSQQNYNKELLESWLNKLSQTIQNKINYLKKNNKNVNNKLEDSIKRFSNSVNGIDYLKKTTTTQANITKYNSMLSDSDINVLKSNYMYIFWSILAISMIILILIYTKK